VLTEQRPLVVIQEMEEDVLLVTTVQLVQSIQYHVMQECSGTQTFILSASTFFCYWYFVVLDSPLINTKFAYI